MSLNQNIYILRGKQNRLLKYSLKDLPNINNPMLWYYGIARLQISGFRIKILTKEEN